MSKVFIKKKSITELENERIVKDIDDTIAAINGAYNRFNVISDENLIEAVILEIASLEAKYKHTLKLAKERNITVNAKRSILVPCLIDIEYAII